MIDSYILTTCLNCLLTSQHHSYHYQQTLEGDINSCENMSAFNKC